MISRDEEMTECRRAIDDDDEVTLGPGGTMRPPRGTLYRGPEVGICVDHMDQSLDQHQF